jgi:hypothetical protein
VAVVVAHARGCHTVRSHMDRRPSINKQQAHVSKMRLVLMRACERSSSPAIAILLGRQHPLSYSTTFPLVSPPITKTTSQPTALPSTTNRTSRPNRNMAAVVPPPVETAVFGHRHLVSV